MSLDASSQCHSCVYFDKGERMTRDYPDSPASCEKLEEEYPNATSEEWGIILNLYSEIAEAGRCEHYQQREIGQAEGRILRRIDE